MRLFRVRVKPNAREAALEEQDDGTWIARVKAAPVDGKANEALVELFARHFGVRKARVSIASGAAARLKTIRIED
ncbi:MAG TPA: DUF167 domain-containing protein [Casimicrobiaceae bacterium]